MTDTADLSRRAFLGGAAAAGAGALATGTRWPAILGLTGRNLQVRVRQNLATLDHASATLQSFERGLIALAALDGRNPPDPRSLSFQAAIHGTWVNPALPAWNQCQHGSFFFLSWHRMYLYYFERLIRVASGDNTFALPFWNYTVASPASRQLPLPFRQPADHATNPLFWPAPYRDPNINNGYVLADRDVDSSQALAETAFTPAGRALGFGGAAVTRPIHNGNQPGMLELRPHNTIHSAMGGLMALPSTAALDPIFWCHHANIDRLWQLWLAQGGGRADPTANGEWMGRRFTFFLPDGNLVQLSGRDVLYTGQQLDYVYGAAEETLAATTTPTRADQPRQNVTTQPVRFFRSPDVWPPAPPVPAADVAASADGVTLADASAQVAIPLSARFRNTDRQRVVLSLEGIDVAESPRVTYDVRIDGPEPAYVASIDYFGLHEASLRHQMERGGAMHKDVRDETLIADVSDIVHGMIAAHRWPDNHVTVTFEPHSYVELHPGDTITAGVSTHIRRVALWLLPAAR